MARIITAPTQIQAAGDPPKIIQEFVGRVKTASHELSIARMVSPSGWSEPGQTPLFDEYSIVLRGRLTVETGQNTYEVAAGQAIIVSKNEWVRYSTPEAEGAEYISVCLPAFSPESVRRDEK